MASIGMKRFREGEEGAEAEGVNVANLLMLLSRGAGAGGDAGRGPRRLFRCKSCSREFPSFQALGGHRASHKKPRLAGEPNTQAAAAPKARAHECPICGVEFAMGQALGGHMRRHRAAVEGFPLVLMEAKPRGGGADKRGSLSLDLDLHLRPAAETDVDMCTLTLGPGLPMVDCSY